MRFFFEITYHGKGYAGWQSQANALGVQSVAEDALSKIFREEIKIIGSGRTDSGVHCVQQFFHADIEKKFTPSELKNNLNAFLPRDIAIRSIRRVKEDASARYDANERTYEYYITRQKDPLKTGLAWYFFKPLEVSTMNKAASLLTGTHDFQAFSKVKTDVNHFICDVKKAAWRESDHMFIFRISANRFLRGMVRAIVGTLIDLGSGKITVREFQDIIHGKDRRKAGMNVPADGLYLVSVKYPKSIFIE